ncbi:MAG: hypothetical protein QOK11_1781, partial [Pseudonocardiales bacterium]|nr:hypothetical protein [Pseudonocardiales bacterium]
HRVAWSDGGHTNEGNLHVLCARHHHLKHETAWQVQRLPNGDTSWTSPSGHRYTKPAATHPVDRTNAAPSEGRSEPDIGSVDPPPF